MALKIVRRQHFTFGQREERRFHNLKRASDHSSGEFGPIKKRGYSLDDIHTVSHDISGISMRQQLANGHCYSANEWTHQTRLARFFGPHSKQIAHLIAQTDHWLFSDFLGYFGHSVQFRVRTLDELAECHSSVFNNLKIIKYTTISTGPHTAGSRRINHRRCSQFSFSLNTLTVRRFTYPDGLVQESE